MGALFDQVMSMPATPPVGAGGSPPAGGGGSLFDQAMALGNQPSTSDRVATTAIRTLAPLQPHVLTGDLLHGFGDWIQKTTGINLDPVKAVGDYLQSKGLAPQWSPEYRQHIEQMRNQSPSQNIIHQLGADEPAGATAAEHYAPLVGGVLLGGVAGAERAAAEGGSKLLGAATGAGAGAIDTAAGYGGQKAGEAIEQGMNLPAGSISYPLSMLGGAVRPAAMGVGSRVVEATAPLLRDPEAAAIAAAHREVTGQEPSAKQLMNEQGKTIADLAGGSFLGRRIGADTAAAEEALNQARTEKITTPLRGQAVDQIPTKQDTGKWARETLNQDVTERIMPVKKDYADFKARNENRTTDLTELLTKIESDLNNPNTTHREREALAETRAELHAMIRRQNRGDYPNDFSRVYPTGKPPPSKAKAGPPPSYQVKKSDIEAYMKSKGITDPDMVTAMLGVLKDQGGRLRAPSDVGMVREVHAQRMAAAKAAKTPPPTMTKKMAAALEPPKPPSPPKSRRANVWGVRKLRSELGEAVMKTGSKRNRTLQGEQRGDLTKAAMKGFPKKQRAELEALDERFHKASLHQETIQGLVGAAKIGEGTGGGKVPFKKSKAITGALEEPDVVRYLKASTDPKWRAAGRVMADMIDRMAEHIHSTSKGKGESAAQVAKKFPGGDWRKVLEEIDPQVAKQFDRFLTAAGALEKPPRSTTIAGTTGAAATAAGLLSAVHDAAGGGLRGKVAAGAAAMGLGNVMASPRFKAKLEGRKPPKGERTLPSAISALIQSAVTTQPGRNVK